MKRAVLLCTLLGCQSAPALRAGTSSQTMESAHRDAQRVPHLEAPITSAHRMVVHNSSTVDIDLYGAYLVDEKGALGTVSLWPNRFDCSNLPVEQHLLPKGGTLEIEFPTRAYSAGTCVPGQPLSPGRYVLRLESGVTEDLFASTTLELPLTAPVRLEMNNHADDSWACDPVRARRVARLTLDAAAKQPAIPAALLVGCNPDEARCGTLPLPETPPPDTCTITLHDFLVRVDRPAGNDAPRGITAQTDRAGVYVRRPDATRTSASQIHVDGKRVTVEGVTDHHMHEHGGDAAQIGAMTLRLFNPTNRVLRIAVDGIEWLTDYGCGLPSTTTKRPSILNRTPMQMPPDSSEVSIQFERQPAYQAYCNRFASRATLRIEGHPVSVTAEHEVTRFEPLP